MSDALRMRRRWNRIGPTSGPANVFDQRYRVQAGAGGWDVIDLRDGECLSAGHKTMKSARWWVEAHLA